MAGIDKLDVEEKEIIWSDRKRILGMPISFTRYYVDEERLYIKRGLFKTEMDEILLYRILDIRSSQTLWQKLFSVGTVTLFSADRSCPSLKLKNIKKPEKLHKFLSNLIEKTRLAKGVAGREIVGMANAMHGPAGMHPDGAHDMPDLPPDMPPPPDTDLADIND